MSDSTTPNNLTGDDAMAFTFLSRAANAIVSASDLAVKLDAVRGELLQLTSVADTLTEIKRTQEDRIATLEAQLASMTEAEARAQVDRREALAKAEARQRDIDLLDGTVADLQSQLAATRSERDDYGLKHIEACDALAAAQTKLDGIIDGLRKVGFNVEAIVPKEPEPTPSDYAEANPDYRASPSVQPEERTPEPTPKPEVANPWSYGEDF